MDSIFDSEHGCMLMRGRPVAKRHLLACNDESMEKINLEAPYSFLKFQPFISSMQTAVAMGHARKVNGIQESERMNDKLRKKYSDEFSRGFPDSVINASLKQKDFTLPFFMDATKFKQLTGSRVLEDRNEVDLTANHSIKGKKRKRYVAVSTSKPPHGPLIKKKITEGELSFNGLTGISLPLSIQPYSRFGPRISQNPVVFARSYSGLQVFDETNVQGAKIQHQVPILRKMDDRAEFRFIELKKEPVSPETVETNPPDPLWTNSNGTGPQFLGCKVCGNTFPAHRDDLFRSHYMIEHNEDPSYEEILNSKMSVDSWFKCRHCLLMVLNNLRRDHYVACCSHLPFHTVFEEIEIPEDIPNLKCGVCKELFETRIELRNHLEHDHPGLSKKIILDPSFRCTICLEPFNDVSACVSHANSCTKTRPSLSTILELAQKNLYCEICKKDHSRIRQALHCYYMKKLFRCLLCLHVSASQPEYFKHAGDYHGMPDLDIYCQLCRARMPIFRVTDHLIDQHYNVALKRAGDLACVRGTLQLQARAAALKRNESYLDGEKETTTEPERLFKKNVFANSIRPENCPIPRVVNVGSTGCLAGIRISVPQRIVRINDSDVLWPMNVPLPPGSIAKRVRVCKLTGKSPQKPPGTSSP